MTGAELLYSLLPAGVYDRDGERLAGELDAEGAQLDILQNRLIVLAQELFPDTCDETFTDWERVAGLPDPCTGALPTVERRRAALLHRLTAQRGQTEAYFIAVAEAFLNAAPGSVWIDSPYDPFRAGDPCGKATYGDAWAYLWVLHIPAAQDFVYFRAGEGQAGQPLRWWSTSQVECLVRREKPAHTVVWFAYQWPEGEEPGEPVEQDLLLGIMRML